MPFVRIGECAVAYADPHTNRVILFGESETGTDQIECPLASIKGHRESIRGVAVTPDGTSIISGDYGGELKVWRTKDQTLVRNLKGHTDAIWTVDVSCDGKSVLSASWDKTLKVWDIESGECKKTLKGHKYGVISGVFSRDGKKALSGSRDRTVKVWDIEREECKVTLEGHLDYVLDVQFSPDEKKALSGSADNTVKLWNIERKECEKTFEGHEESVLSVRFSLDGKTILSASRDKTIKLWSSESGACTKTLTGHSGGVVSAVYSSDESHVVSCGFDGVRVWNVHSGECVRTFEDRSSFFFRRVCVSRDGKTIFYGSNNILKVRSVAKGTQLKTLSATDSTITAIELSSDGKTLIAHCEDGSQTQWPTHELNIPVILRPSDIAFSAALARGSVVSRSIKVLFLGATEAGKTALVAALRGETLPGEKDRSVATRLHKLRMVYHEGMGVFVSVPVDEFHLRSVMGVKAEEKEEEVAEDTNSTDEEAAGPFHAAAEPHHPSTTAPPTVTPVSAPHADAGPASVSSAPSHDAITVAPSAEPTMSTEMAFVRGLLESELREEHVDMDTFDFAGESMYDSLPALFMGSESVYVLVFDLSVMNDALKAQRQYEHLSKWADIIAHQVPTTAESYFRVIIVGTHIDTFAENTVPDDLVSLVSREILRLVGPVLGSHLMMPPETRGVPFFQVGSRARVGLGAVSTAMHKAVRNRTLPLEFVAAQDLIGRWARMGRVPLLSSVSSLDGLELNDDPVVRLGGMLASESAIREGLVPYLENAADILVCREDATSEVVKGTDTIVFDVPRLIGALELLCSVVMAQWGRATSKRAQAMLREVTAAGLAHADDGMRRTARLLGALDASKEQSESGFPAEVAEWLVWTAPSSRAGELFAVVSEAEVEVERVSAPVEPPPSPVAVPSEPTKPLSFWAKLFRAFDKPSSSELETDRHSLSSHCPAPVIDPLPASEPDLIPLLAGADVTDVPSFMLSLERLSLALRRDDRLFVPMLLPHHAAFLDIPVTVPAQLFLYQFVDDELLPVSLATFHLLMVALWRTSLRGSPIRATQRCTNAMTMAGCAPVRLRLNASESFVRIDVMDDSDAEQVQRTLEQICVKVCEQTRSLRWGWRGTNVVVPAHPHNSESPLFPAKKVACTPAHYQRMESVRAEMAAHPGERVCNHRLEEWWVAAQPNAACAPPAYTHAAALIIGVSRYGKKVNPVFRGYPSLPSVVSSVDKLTELWTNRNFKVRTVVDRHKGDRVTKERITVAAQALAQDVGRGAGKDTLLVVHLLGHGAEDSLGGLLLSDARETMGGRVTRFSLLSLQSILQDEVGWRGYNVLVVCDFCNSGAQEVEESLTMGRQGAPVVGHGRQMITSALKDAPSWAEADETTLTRLLVDALGPNQSVFEAGETVISAVELCRRLQPLDPDIEQSFSVCRIWSDWDGATNDGDILVYRTGNGVVPAVVPGP